MSNAKCKNWISQDGTQPEATVKLQNGDVVNVSTWTQIIQVVLL